MGGGMRSSNSDDAGYTEDEEKQQQQQKVHLKWLVSFELQDHFGPVCKKNNAFLPRNLRAGKDRF